MDGRPAMFFFEEDLKPCMGRGQLRPRRERERFFLFYIKKIKISKIYVRFEKFRKYTPVARPRGDKTLM